MPETVVLTVPFTAGITQAEGEKAILDLVERRIRELFLAVADEGNTLHSAMRRVAAHDIDGEELRTIVAAIDNAVITLNRRRIEIENRFEARAALIERVDGSPNLELVRAS